ncbi:MAG TPA: hypothetical protein VEA69_14170, partial [Tepidisphaeraceae bacterium]|nr:hypothetical protein [Tepidisphaeraceae bacterium]
MASTTHTRDGPPVDRDRRARLAELLRQFASGRSTNDTYEDRFFAEVFAGRPAAQHDPALFAIWSRSWLLYSDLREHRLVGRYALPAAVRRDVCRWVVFLHTNVPYE